MEMRAREDTPMSQDLIPPLPPIAAALHDKFLNSHCSSCFCHLPSSSFSCSLHVTSRNPVHSCSACSCSVEYCSPNCAASDADRHFRSGECHLFLLLSSPAGDTAHVRVALRLLHSFDRLGFLNVLSMRHEPLRRIGGLLADCGEDMDESCEIVERIREGAALMVRARNPGMTGGFSLDRNFIDEEVLRVVMMNSVEVEIGELGGIGVAVYGPWFSWFNHSCVPNACYRFELYKQYEVSRPCDLGNLKVLPAGGDREAFDMWKMWNFVDSSFAPGLCWFGPRIVVRSIKPLKKGDEALRQSDLLAKYQFFCRCARCCISPQMHMDYILYYDLRSLNCENCYISNSECMKIADSLEEAIDEYILNGNPETCCIKLESLLFNNSNCKPYHVEKAGESMFRLHPLHYLSLRAYIALSSTYKIKTGKAEASQIFNMARAAAAYSLLLAGATHHLFLSETSIIANAALYWINAGESILHLIKISKAGSLKQLVGVGISSEFADSFFTTEDQSVSIEDLFYISAQFMKSFSLVMKDIWPFLAHGFSFLECIQNPVDFSWLKISNSYVGDGRVAAGSGMLDFAVEGYGLHQFAFLCLACGRHLANICYGPESHLSNKATVLNGMLSK